jgi:hypothetical protein
MQSTGTEKTFDGFTLDQIIEACSTAHMADEYGEVALSTIVLFLLNEGHSAYEVEAIVKSKHLRWADDTYGAGDGQKTNSVTFQRYYDLCEKRTPGYWKAEARDLVRLSSLDLDGGLGSEAAV